MRILRKAHSIFCFQDLRRTRKRKTALVRSAVLLKICGLNVGAVFDPISSVDHLSDSATLVTVLVRFVIAVGQLLEGVLCPNDFRNEVYCFRHSAYLSGDDAAPGRPVAYKAFEVLEPKSSQS